MFIVAKVLMKLVRNKKKLSGETLKSSNANVIISSGILYSKFRKLLMICDKGTNLSFKRKKTRAGH